MKLRSRAARRYAKALHDLAAGASMLDAVAADMKQLLSNCSASGELQAFLGNYLLPADRRVAVMSALFADHCTPLVWRFMRFLESKRRLGLLADIAADFQELEEARKGIVRANLASAFGITSDDASELAGRLGARLGKQLLLETEEMPGLLGGCRLQVGDRVYDFSLAAQLRMLRQTMMAG